MLARHLIVALLATSLAGGCNPSPSQQAAAPAMKVRGPEQDKLHQLAAFDLAIALKHAIYSAGYTCQRLTDAGYVGTYKNLDMWMASCSEHRDWAVFAAPDGTAQVRDCKDVADGGLPKCAIAKRPAGSFTERPGARLAKHATFG